MTPPRRVPRVDGERDIRISRYAVGGVRTRTPADERGVSHATDSASQFGAVGRDDVIDRGRVVRGSEVRDRRRGARADPAAFAGDILAVHTFVGCVRRSGSDPRPDGRVPGPVRRARVQYRALVGLPAAEHAVSGSLTGKNRAATSETERVQRLGDRVPGVHVGRGALGSVVGLRVGRGRRRGVPAPVGRVHDPPRRLYDPGVGRRPVVRPVQSRDRARPNVGRRTNEVNRVTNSPGALAQAPVHRVRGDR